jgi:hypothetical protein
MGVTVPAGMRQALQPPQQGTSGGTRGGHIVIGCTEAPNRA